MGVVLFAEAFQDAAVWHQTDLFLNRTARLAKQWVIENTANLPKSTIEHSQVMEDFANAAVALIKVDLPDAVKDFSKFSPRNLFDFFI